MNTKKILVTGGLGFIGSHFVELLLDRGYAVVNVDKKTKMSREDLKFEKHPRYEYIQKDICDLRVLPVGISHIVNFAAESHVEDSLLDSQSFIRSNVLGVYNLLERVRELPPNERPVFVHISTDEVYGDILNGSFREEDRLKPSNPYSATKAAADQLVLAWARTHGLKVRLCRPSNNYGFGQHGTKLIPNTMKRAFRGQKAVVHGEGTHTRAWTWVGDNCEAIYLVMTEGEDGEIYNISAEEELTNLEVIRKVLAVMGHPEDFYEHAEDRPNQDTRYAVATAKIRALGWRPTTTLVQYLPICKTRNEERTRSLGVGKKRLLARLLGLEGLWYSKK